MKVARGNLRPLSLNDCAIHGIEVCTVDKMLFMFPVLISCGQRKFSVRDNIKEQRFLFLKWQYSQVAYTFIPFFRSIPVVGKLDIAIHRINHYLADKYLENQFVLSTGWRFTQWIAYPPSEQLGPCYYCIFTTVF